MLKCEGLLGINMGDNAKTIRLTMTAHEVECLADFLEANSNFAYTPVLPDEDPDHEAQFLKLVNLRIGANEKLHTKLKIALLRSQL